MGLWDRGDRVSWEVLNVLMTFCLEFLNIKTWRVATVEFRVNSGGCVYYLFCSQDKDVCVRYFDLLHFDDIHA